MAVFVNEPWKNPSTWKREGLPDSVFLDPKRRKYPVKKTAKGPYNVRALTAAAHYAKMYNDIKVYRKAKQLLEEYKRAKNKRR
ncbi:MAG: hypothetical protein ACP5LI_08025 [Hydrogenobaculum sp.]